MGEVGDDDDGGGARVFQLMLELTRCVERVDVDHGQAGTQHAEDADRVLQQVGHHHGNAFALAELECLLQIGAQITRTLLDFAVAHGAAGELDRIGKGGTIAEFLRALLENLAGRLEFVDVDFGGYAGLILVQPDFFHTLLSPSCCLSSAFARGCGQADVGFLGTAPCRSVLRDGGARSALRHCTGIGKSTPSANQAPAWVDATRRRGSVLRAKSLK